MTPVTNYGFVDLPDQTDHVLKEKTVNWNIFHLKVCKSEFLVSASEQQTIFTINSQMKTLL